MQNSVAKKFFAVGSAAAMALAFSAPMTAFAAAHANGTNVNKAGTVGMIIDGTFRPYTSAGAFLSYGFNSWSSVVDANSDDNALPVGSFIPPQDGKIICSDRGSDKGTCYLITGSMKAGFTSASVFTGLGFSFSRAMYGDVSWMSSTSNIDNTTAAHRPGVLVNNKGTVQLMGTSGLLGIPDLATFNSWGYSFNDVVPANAADMAMTQTGVMAARVAGQLSPTGVANPGQTQTSSGSVSVSLASDTPVAGTIVKGAAATPLAKFVFTGSGTVTQVQVKRTGVSADAVLSNVYLFDGSTRLTDAASVGGNSTVTFANANGLFTVSGSKTISVVADIDNSSNTTSGQTVALQLVSYTVTGGSAASVTVTGNLMTVSAVSDLATIDFAAVSPTGGSYDPAADVEVFRSNVAVGTRDVTMSRLSLRQIGSVNTSDITNFRLRVDGQQLSQVQNMTSDGYVNFAFSPVTLKSGTRVVSVLADIIGGSSRTFQFSIRNKADTQFTDTNYGVNIAPTYKSGAFPVAESTNSINAGTVTIQKNTDSPSVDVTNNSSDVSLATYTVTAYGEPMKIETIKAGFSSSNNSVGSLRNGRLLINGAQYGSTATLVTASTTGTTYTLNYTVQPGTPVTLEIRADMYDNDGSNSLVNGNSVTASLLATSSNVQRMTSLGYVSYPTATITGNSINVVTGSMALNLNANYANQTTPLPQTGYKIASFNLVGSTSEDINVTGIDVAIKASSTLLDYSEITDVKVMVAGNMFGTVKSTLASGTSTFSGNYTLAKSSTVPVEVWASVQTPAATGAPGENFSVSLGVNGTTASSSNSVAVNQFGQTITYGSSTIGVAVDPSTPVAAIVAGNQTRTAAAFKFTTTNDTYTIKELTVNLAGYTTVSNVVLKDGSTVLATLPGGASSVTFTGLAVAINPNSTKVLTVDLQLGMVGYGAGTSGENAKVTLYSYKYLASAATNGQQFSIPSGVAGNNMYVVKAVPTITNVNLPSGTLTVGTNTISKFSVSSGGTGTISWTKLVFSVSTSTGVSVTSPTLWDADSNTQIAGNMTVTYSASPVTVQFDATNEQEISGAKNYVLKATVGGANAGVAGAYVTTSIAAPTASMASKTTAASATGTTASFVWSDESAQTHSVGSQDWYSEFLVKNIPTDSQNLTK